MECGLGMQCVYIVYALTSGVKYPGKGRDLGSNARSLPGGMRMLELRFDSHICSASQAAC